MAIQSATARGQDIIGALQGTHTNVDAALEAQKALLSRTSQAVFQRSERSEINEEDPALAQQIESESYDYYLSRGADAVATGLTSLGPGEAEAASASAPLASSAPNPTLLDGQRSGGGGGGVSAPKTMTKRVSVSMGMSSDMRA